MKLNDPAQSRTLAPPEESVLAVRPGRLPARFGGVAIWL